MFYHSYLPSARPACRQDIDRAAGLVHPSHAPLLLSMVHVSGGFAAAAFVVLRLTGPSIPNVPGVLWQLKQTYMDISVCYPCIIIMQRMIVFLKWKGLVQDNMGQFQSFIYLINKYFKKSDRPHAKILPVSNSQKAA